MSPVTRADFKRYVRNSLIAFVLLVGAIGYALTTKPDVSTLEAGLVNACDRENILHAQTNTSDIVSFRLLSISGQTVLALAKSDPKNAKQHRLGARLLFDSARQLKITALTDCAEAVKRPEAYKYPVARPIGGAETGHVYTSVQKIVRQSEVLLRQDH